MNIIAFISCRTGQTDKQTDKHIQEYHDHIVTERMLNMSDKEVYSKQNALQLTVQTIIQSI